MADVEFPRNEIADPQVAHRVVADGLRLEIEVEVLGWTERVSVASPAQPGAVRGAVERMLRSLL